MAEYFADLSKPDQRAELMKTMRPSNTSILSRAVDAAYFTAVADVFARMVKDLDHTQLPAARSDMAKRLDNVRAVHAEMSQRVTDLEA